MLTHINITYERLLTGIMECTSGNTAPSYLLCGPGTFEEIYRWLRAAALTQAHAKGEIAWVQLREDITIQSARLIPVMGWPEGELRCVTPEYPNDPRYNGTIKFDSGGDK